MAPDRSEIRKNIGSITTKDLGSILNEWICAKEGCETNFGLVDDDSVSPLVMKCGHYLCSSCKDKLLQSNGNGASGRYDCQYVLDNGDCCAMKANKGDLEALPTAHHIKAWRKLFRVTGFVCGQHRRPLELMRICENGDCKMILCVFCGPSEHPNHWSEMKHPDDSPIHGHRLRTHGSHNTPLGEDQLKTFKPWFLSPLRPKDMHEFFTVLPVCWICDIPFDRNNPALIMNCGHLCCRQCCDKTQGYCDGCRKDGKVKVGRGWDFVDRKPRDLQVMANLDISKHMPCEKCEKYHPKEHLTRKGLFNKNSRCLFCPPK